MKMSLIVLLLTGSQAFAETRVATGLGVACNRELPEAFEAAIGQALNKAMIDCGATRKVNVQAVIREEARNCFARVILRYSCDAK